MNTSKFVNINIPIKSFYEEEINMAEAPGKFYAQIIEVAKKLVAKKDQQK